ncbi:regulator of (H+)-ATPase in vacuolar membrane [Sorochytrium milnesiophthora]
MVYVTGSLLHIEQLSPALRHVVTIDLLHHTQLESTNGVTSDGSGILAVAADPYARVAVSIGCKVVVLQLDMESATYTETATFTAAAPVTSLSWNGRSMVYGRCIAESFLAKFSPDGELFATVSKYDRRVKIWAEHKTSGQDKTPQLAPSPTSDASVKPLAPGVKYSFTYLVHPRAVTNFIWRHNSQFAITQDPPVLLTNCVDSVARLWAQSNSQFGHFVLITSIDARTFPGAEQQQHHHHPPPAVNGYGDGHTISSESVHSLTPATPSGIAFLHWLDKDELLATVNVAAQKNSLVKVGTVEKAPRPPRQKHVEPSSSTLSLLLPDLSEFGTDENTAQPTENIQTARKRVLEMVQGYDDIIFTVQMNGSFLVWGVQRLFQTPRTIPKVLAVMRLAASLLPSDYDYFTTPTAVYHPPAAPHSPALTSQDIELHMIAANVDTGALRCYSINLADVFVNRPGAKIALRKEWNGHSDDAGIAYKPHSLRSVHPIGSHFVATRLGSEAVVWQLEGRNRGLRRSEGLVELLRMEDLTEREQLVTFGGAPYFGMTFPTDDHGLRVFHARMLERERSVDVKEIGVLSTTSARFSECFYAVSSPESLVVGADEPAVPTKCRLLMLHRQSLDLTTLNFEIALGGAVSIVDEQTRCLRDCCPAISDVCHTAFIHSSAALVSSAQRERIYEFVTLSSDGALRLWRANSTENAWQVVSETRILDPVADVKEVTACMRKVAIAFVDRIRIYDISILQNTLHLEYTVPSQEPVIAASLYPAITGLSFLAYATPDSMHILAPYPDTKMSGSMDLVWRQVASPTLLKQQKCRAEDTLSAMRWVGTGDLIAFCGDMVIRGDKWTVSPSEWTGPVATYTPHLHHLPHQLSSLPSYHPHLLMQYLLWNKFDLTKHTLTQLYYYLRGTFGEVISENMGKSHPVLVIPSPVGPKMEELLSDKSSTGLPNEQFSAGNMFGDADASDSDLLDMNAYTQDKATYLTSALANINLPFLDAVDQQRLIAVTETVLQLESQRQSLDANGVRYVLFLRIFLHLQKSPMPADRPEAMTSEGISWGFFSESQDVLVQNCVSQYENALTWPRARALGMGWWVHNLDTLKTLAETIARNTYVQDERNPVGCSLLYLALRKRKLLLGLWKQAAGHAEQGAMSNFLSKDFDDERWKTAALKNAFVLLGRQRHEYAAAFFLLGDSLKDAVSVCLKQLNDPQLAIVLCRLYQGDSSDVLKQILSTQVLPDMVERGDRFLTVMVLWLMREKDQALRATLQPTSAATDTALTTSPTLQTDRVSPQLWILYKHVSQYMRKHHHTNYKLSTGAENAAVSDVISFYEARGCPSLALYVFQQWQAERAEGDHAPAGSVRRTAAKQVSADITGILDIDDWGKPASPVEAAPDTSAFDALFGDGPAAKRNNANDDFDSMFGGSGSGNTKPDDDFDRMFKSDKAVEDDLFGAPSVQAADPAPTAPAPAQAGTDAEPAVEFTEQQMAWCRERIFSRSLWPLAESAKAIGHNRTMFAKELFFEDYQLRLKDGFAVLCNVVQVDQGTAQHLLVQLCRVAHLTRHLVELGLCDMVHYEGYAGELAELLLDTTHAVSVLTVDDIRFGKGFKDIFLLNVANELLQSLYRVSDPRPFDVQRIHGPGIITALSILTLCMIEVRNYRAMMLLFRHTGAVYDALSTDRYQNIRGVLQPIADNIEALMHPYQPPPTEEMDSYSAEGSGPVVIIQYLALRYLIQPLELFLEANRSTLPGKNLAADIP